MTEARKTIRDWIELGKQLKIDVVENECVKMVFLKKDKKSTQTPLIH
jgi:hypothetical protein